MFKSILQKWLLLSALIVAAISPESSGQQLKSPEGLPKWPDVNWQESSFKETGRKLDVVKDISKPGPDIEFLYSKASDLLKRSSQERDNFFRCERLITATNALLDAAYGIYSSGKPTASPRISGVSASLYRVFIIASSRPVFLPL